MYTRQHIIQSTIIQGLTFDYVHIVFFVKVLFNMVSLSL